MKTGDDIKNYTTSPCTTDGAEGHWSGQWMVWDMYRDLPPKPVFVGTMEDAGGVADALNRRLSRANQPRAWGGVNG
jgi:hypothetical protein